MKLNLGSGVNEIEGYVNVDISNGLNVYPLEFESESADEIRASHILEHFPYRETQNIVNEWVRVLKPNGILKIAVPDMRWIASQILLSNPRVFPLQSFIMGGQIDNYDYHKSVFTSETLYSFLATAGLTDIQFWESEIKDCAALEVSLNLMGRKA